MGWIKKPRDTDWRDVSDDLLYGATGTLHVRREGLTVWWRVKDLLPGTAHAFYLPPSGLRVVNAANTYPAAAGTTGLPFYRDMLGRLCHSIYIDPVSAGFWWEGMYVLPPGTAMPGDFGREVA